MIETFPSTRLKRGQRWYISGAFYSTGMLRETDVRFYNERRLIENRNGKLKHIREVFSGFDLTAKKHWMAVDFASAAVEFRELYQHNLAKGKLLFLV